MKRFSHRAPCYTSRSTYCVIYRVIYEPNFSNKENCETFAPAQPQDDMAGEPVMSCRCLRFNFITCCWRNLFVGWGWEAHSSGRGSGLGVYVLLFLQGLSLEILSPSVKTLCRFYRGALNRSFVPWVSVVQFFNIQHIMCLFLFGLRVYVSKSRIPHTPKP